jgi:predicted Zn-dependent protease
MQYFAGTVYARPASFRLLPQLRAPGMASHTYAGWLALAQRYADQGKTDEAQRVYEDLLEQNPYLDQAKKALAALAGNQK